MPNPYFQFKQFTIYHDRCAMKVGTDGVLLGAWTDVSDACYVLDIGTGTGLIALMIAQRNSNATIDAIDIDTDAIVQSAENVGKSPFASRIQCVEKSLQDLVSYPLKKYDAIISNPPFFIESLKSPHQGRTLARHTDSLPVEDLISISSRLLSERGKLSVIYPSDYKNILVSLAGQNNLFVSRITNVFPTPSSVSKRILVELSKNELPLVETDLLIEKERHVYSDEFTALVKVFYLKM
ncbi:MAG: methyltransferase [Prevotella sp.]|jgi:tRNA1Val (adenine37-N6)-methyltransferase|nr:methyltransferase [Prevotella sp.]